MGVNKVEYGSSTLVDLTGDTVTPETLLQGETAHNAAGNRITGTARPGVQSFNGRSGSVLPMAGDYSADQVNYDSNKTVKQVIDALATKETSDITGQQSLLKDTVGWTGKNVFNFNDRRTSGSQYISGTQEAIKIKTTEAGTYKNAGFYINVKPNTNYILNTDVEYISGKAYANVYKADGSGSAIAKSSVITVNSNIHLQFNSGENERLLISLFCTYGTSEVGEVVYNDLMIYRADITDPTYEPYHESVEVMYEEEIHGVNLLKNTATSTTTNGITFTVNSDGSYTTNGTATADAFLIFVNGENTLLEKGKSYIASSGQTQNGGLQVYYKVSSSDSWIQIARAVTSEVEFTLPSNANYILIRGYVGNGQTVSNLVYRPMLRKADIEDSTYRPYNPQAIQNQLNAQGVLGAKNLLRLTSVTGMGEGTFVGITVSYSYNTDGSIKSVTLNGECTQTSNGYFYQFSQRLNPNSIKLLPNKEYIFSIDNANSNIALQVGYTKNNAYQMVKDGSYNEGVIKFITPSDCEGAGWTIQLIKKSGSLVLNNWIIYPMLRLASDPDDTYQPYAMTNRELTEKVFEKRVLSSGDDLNNITETGIYHVAVGVGNVPDSRANLLLIVDGFLNGQIRQTLTTKENIYTRSKEGTTWSSWYKFTGTVVS